MSPVPLPETMPVMVLDNCFVFPGCRLPLRIFESRYRRMLEDALQGDRMFCVGCRRINQATGEEDVWPMTTAAVISVSIREEDGTSQLVLTGLQRITLTGWVQLSPYRIARFEPLATVMGDAAQVAETTARIRALLPPAAECPDKDSAAFMENLRSLKGDELFLDTMAQTWSLSPETCRRLLAEPRLDKRATLLWGAMTAGL
jgi:ATP-dependent Lon protease